MRGWWSTTTLVVIWGGKGEVGEAAEGKREGEHGEERVEDDPEDADSGLFVTYFHVAPDEKIEKFAILPDFGEAEFEPALRRLDANFGRGRCWCRRYGE